MADANSNLSLPSSNQCRFMICGYYTEKSDFHREDYSIKHYYFVCDLLS